jgi:RNA polymerase sigma-70 factor, ECF subfamily
MDQPETIQAEQDGALVAAVRSGDQAAFARLYDRYARLVRAVCFDATGHGEQAQDLCQETFLRAYRKLDDLREPDNFAGWLLGIARLVGQEWRRSKARDRHRYTGLAAGAAQLSRASSGDDEDLCRLRQGLALLPDDERLALHLFYLLEQPAEQARTTLNLSRAGFYALVARARRKLAQFLQDDREVQP